MDELEYIDYTTQPFEHNIGIEPEDIKYMENLGSSCYLDSVLFGLFIYPTDFVNNNIINVDIKNYPNINYELDQDGKLSPEDSEKLRIVETVRAELSKIESSMFNDSDHMRYCTDLRKSLKYVPNSENYHLPGEKDAGDFLQYILDMFPTYLATKTTTSYGTNDKGPLSLANLKMTSKHVDKKASVMQFVDSFQLSDHKSGASIRRFLNQTDDSGTLDSSFTDGQGNRYNRRVSKTSLDSSPIIIFRIQRLDWTGNVNSKNVIPPETISLHPGETYSLSSIVVYIKRHYIAYFKLSKDWYVYNDMVGVYDIGSYDDMINSNPSPATAGVLYFYIKME
jgi:hypothetical protein